MTEYKVRVVEAEVGDTVEIPDNARDVEIEYFTHTWQEPGIGGSEKSEERVRVKYLEKQGDSVL